MRAGELTVGGIINSGGEMALPFTVGVGEGILR